MSEEALVVILAVALFTPVLAHLVLEAADDWLRTC